MLCLLEGDGIGNFKEGDIVSALEDITLAYNNNVLVCGVENWLFFATLLEEAIPHVLDSHGFATYQPEDCAAVMTNHNLTDRPKDRFFFFLKSIIFACILAFLSGDLVH